MALIFGEIGILPTEDKWINLSNITNYEIHLKEATINTCQAQIIIKIIKNFLFYLSIVLKFYIITVHSLTNQRSGFWEMIYQICDIFPLQNNQLHPNFPRPSKAKTIAQLERIY